MTNNNRKITWKAIVAVVLVMASLFAMSSLVNAGIVELILGEEYAAVASAWSSSWKSHSGDCQWINSDEYKVCTQHNTRQTKQICMITDCTEYYWPTCPSCK